MRANADRDDFNSSRRQKSVGNQLIEALGETAKGILKGTNRFMQNGIREAKIAKMRKIEKMKVR